ncbi:MAG: hypothetical protein GXX96_06600, partial [Planctomycetaceae bacterium]|nr:hypothetical protein [Planctomycetaceae bacterium]
VYYVRVGKYQWSDVVGEYQLRVELARGIDLESDAEYANDTLAGADAVTLSAVGGSQRATVAGVLMDSSGSNSDEDLFRVGNVAAGQTILASIRLPGGSVLAPVVEIRDATNNVVSIATNPVSAVARADLGTPGTYYVAVLGLDGMGLRGTYLLDLAVKPTDELAFADLAVTSITGPLSATSGETIPVSWSVGNYGALATEMNSWIDRIVLSPDQQFGDGDDLNLAFVPHSGALDINQSYTAAVDVQLPLGIEGDYWLLVKTDASNSVSEFIFEDNNVGVSATAIPITLTPYPDLEACNVTAPTLVLATDDSTITWSVTNRGIAETNDGTPGGAVAEWLDRIVLSANATLGDQDDSVVASVPHSGVLAPSESYDGSWTGTFPSGLSGDYHIFVYTDFGDVVYEYNNTFANVAVAAGTMAVAPRPFADLSVTSITAPATANVGGQLALEWTVINSNDAWSATLMSSWHDRVVLSRNATYGDGDDRSVATVSHQGPLAIGESYTTDATVELPANMSGWGHLFVVTDVYNRVFEFQFEGNNASGPSAIEILAPDLVIQASLAESEARFGDAVTVDWTVRNEGPGVMNGNVEDRVWLSTDETVSSDDTPLVLLPALQRPLDAGQEYRQDDIEITLPLTHALAEGHYYILVEADSLGNQHEANETNNVGVAGAIQLTYPPPPDLHIAGLRVLESRPVSGGTVTVAWTTANHGTAGVAEPFVERLVVRNLSTSNTLLDVTLPLDPAVDGSLAAGASIDRQHAFTLPHGLAGTGQLQVTVTTDWADDIFELNAQGNAEQNNVATITVTAVLATYPDLTIHDLSVVPAEPRSGDQMAVRWRIENQGDGPADQAFSDRVRVVNTDTGQTLLVHTIKYDPAHSAVIGSGQGRDRQVNLTLPEGSASVGQLEITVILDVDNEVFEYHPSVDAEGNNLSVLPVTCVLAPYPDLTVSGVDGPGLTIGDPAQVTVSWTVTNVGTGPGTAETWTDVVIASPDEISGNGDDRVLAEFVHTGGLDIGQSYSRTETFLLPPSFVGRYHLFVRTDFEDAVFENDRESNNAAESDEIFDAMLIPYADLEITSLQAVSQAFSGQPLDMTWTVTNRGIGLTSRADWTDRIYLASDTAGHDLYQVWTSYGLRPWSVSFSHMGHLAVGGSYVRTGSVTLPEGLEGDYYLVLKVGDYATGRDPFEFVYLDNNQRVSGAVPVTLTTSPDLQVTDIIAPDTTQEGTLIDVTWTVENAGLGIAEGPWEDRVYLQREGDPDAQAIELGKYTYEGTLPPGMFYTRSEQIAVPAHINDVFRLVVHTNHGNQLYEHGPAAGNNVRADDTTLAVAVKPRPDLQIASIIAPDSVDPGGAFSAEFVVINQGTAATTVPNWIDRIYLSLDGKLSYDDILIESLTNGAALAPGESYFSVATSVEVPMRYRGEMYVLAVADAGGRVDEWPNEGNNTLAKLIYVNPLPLADLVTSDVVAPAQAVEGSRVEVRYTVTNRGPGETNVDYWMDTIWLTRDKNRPHPGQGDVLLETFPHYGSLLADAGYDRITTVTLPTNLVSGTYYIMPWTDPYGVVLEDTLAINVNPDDPHEINNNNYKARAIDIIGISVEPDLAVRSLLCDPRASGGEDFTVTWTVENRGPIETQTKWTDRILLARQPDGGESLVLASVTHDSPLGPGASYTKTVTVPLTPSALGSYVVVITDSGNRVAETDELNNDRSTLTDVTPVPTDLLVTDLEVPPENYSGEKTTLRYTVTNVGQLPVWPGTRLWSDYIWLSADTEFDKERSSFLGEIVHSHDQPLAPGESYEVEFEATLPTGIEGDYYFYIHMGAHNPQRYSIAPVAGTLDTSWWPADSGSNENWRSYFERRPFEDPRNNLASVHLPVTYYEPDLLVTDLVVPTGATSGETVPIAFTVLNDGVRATRQSVWIDKVFLSEDPSLDAGDLYLGQYLRQDENNEGLAAGASYTATVDVPLPDGIEGGFYVLVYADSAAHRSAEVQSTIGYGLPGVAFEAPRRLAKTDQVSAARRELARAIVGEFQDEGNNITSAALPVTLANPPDLQVTALVVPPHVTRGQPFELTYTVTNLGGDTPEAQSVWDDLIYLSRDTFLDLRADRYLAASEHEGLLAAGQSYTITLSVEAPGDMTGPYYVVVATDPPRETPLGKIFEHLQERNNDRASQQPVIIDLPPASDLQVSTVSVSGSARPGESVFIGWEVCNLSNQPAEGRWSDTVYLSRDANWDITDRPLGRATYAGRLEPGACYTLTLDAPIPPVTPGEHRIIVRTDIFNQVYEDLADMNNAKASEGTLQVTADEIVLGVPHETTLGNEQYRLFQIALPQDQTVRVTLTSGDPYASNELFIRHDQAPTSAAYDAAYQGALAANQTAVIPSTEPGMYYVLIHGYAVPAGVSNVTLLAELVPLAITGVHTDVGGDSKYVTTAIQGARFHPDAIVKLVRPGFAEYEPVVYDVVSGTEIIAAFDLTGAPHGLYDLKVINPGGAAAIVPYRFQVERALEPDVTIGIGGPRYVLAGDIGTYSIALQSTSNVDTPYVAFDVGVPELGLNAIIYNLPYLTFHTNVRGSPDAGAVEDVPWAALDGEINTNGQNRAPGYLFDQYADGFTGFTVNVATYPGLKELNERAWEAFKSQIYAALPEASGMLDEGPHVLDELWNAFFPSALAQIPAEGRSIVEEELKDFSLYDLWNTYGAVPDECRWPFIPFQFHVLASATAMTRDEFIAHATSEALKLRDAIVADEEASPALVTMAADESLWSDMYVASLEEAGLLRPEDSLPPIREHPKIVSLMATLTTGILVGPAENEVRTSGSLLDFFDQVRQWYGHDSDQLADIDYWDVRQNECFYYEIPYPELPQFEDYDLGLSNETHFEAFRVYVPWIPFEDRGEGIPPEYQIDGPHQPVDGEYFVPLDLSGYYAEEGRTSRLASLTGPTTIDSGGFLPPGQPLPYTIQFQNDSESPTHTAEIRAVTNLDEDLDLQTFRLGDLKVGDINVHIPEGRALFQGDFDFATAKGFILRVSAGIDVASSQATWLIQAIDPLTGEVVRDSQQGLLPPDDTLGIGAGFVSYTIEPFYRVETGTAITAQARVLFNNAPPEDTAELRHVVDAVAPSTDLTVNRLSADGNDYLVKWIAQDDRFGSGVRHVTLYVAEDGGDFKIWLRQIEESSGQEVFSGEAGHAYEFLTLATDRAGNRERPPFWLLVPDDAPAVNLGTPLTVPETTPPNFGQAPEPSPQPSTNPLFESVERQIPGLISTSRPPEFTEVLRPFTAQAFAWNIDQSHADIGPMAIAEMPDGSLLISGGPYRNQLFKFDEYGGQAQSPWAELDYPIFNLAFDNNGNLWATTGGGPLLQLDPDTGEILNEFGDGLTIALAIEPATSLIYVSSGQGIEIFDPDTQQFTHFSRDLNLRVGGLTFQSDGTLWATTWPDRRQVVRFNEYGRAETMLQFDADIDSIAIGRPGTQLENLLFVSHNSGPTDELGSQLTLADMATLRRVAVASGGSRGDAVATTSDGRLLISQSHQVDVLNPLAPPVIVAVNPPANSVVALPLPQITITFDQDMAADDGNSSDSVLSTDNYYLFGQRTGAVSIQSVAYSGEGRTVSLVTDALEPDIYELYVSSSLTSLDGLPLAYPYFMQFTAVSDFSPYVEFQFDTVRSNRADGTVSFDVVVTNVGDYDLVLPLMLVLDPAAGYDGVPVGPAGQTPDGRWLIDLSVAEGYELHPGDSTLARTVTIVNPEHRRVDYDTGLSALPTDNEAPVLDSVPLTEAVAGQPYEYLAHATDPDGAAVVYLLQSGPDGLDVDPQTGRVTWSPTVASPLQANVVLHAYDPRGGRGAQQFTINVTSGNRPPVVASLPHVIEAVEGQAIRLEIDAYDPDGDLLIVTADQMPAGARLDPVTRTFLWTPDYDAAGTYEDVTFSINDVTHQVVRQVDFWIRQGNRAPELAPPADRTISEGDRLRFYLDGDDPDGDPVTFSSYLLPPGAFLDPKTGLFEWTPFYFQEGEYEVPVTLSNDGGSVTEHMTIAVLNANGPPAFVALGQWTVYEGGRLGFLAEVRDPDNPGYEAPLRLEDGTLYQTTGGESTVTYQVEGLPPGATFDPETTLFFWEPDFDDAGEYAVTFTATDDGDRTGTPLFSSVTVPLTVLNFNRPPEITEIPNVTVRREEMLHLGVQATDPDGNPITLAAANALPGYDLPSFVSFVDNGDGTGRFQFSPDTGDRGDHTVTLDATDDGDGGGDTFKLTSSYSFVVTVESENDPPVLDYVGDKVAVVGEPFTLTVRAHDIDQEPLDFQVNGLPPEATLTPGVMYGTATLQWTPTTDDLGNYSVLIEVADGGNGNPGLTASDAESIALVVRAHNSAPQLAAVGNQTIAEGQTLTLPLVATDDDLDTLTFTAENLPPGAELDPVTGVFTWSPRLDQAGLYESVVLRVGDGHQAASETIVIDVTNTNQPPRLVPLTPQSAREGTALEYTIVAGDSDRDPLIYTATAGLPDGALFNSQTGWFYWRPGYEQAGTYEIAFTAQDPEGLTDSMTVTVTVDNVNRPPVVSTSDHAATIGRLLDFLVTASDPDLNTTFTFAAEGLPEGAALDPDTGRFTWTAGPGQEGEYVVVLAVSDGAATSTESILIVAAVQPDLPQVTVELTPSFPAIPGQPVLVHAIADSLADITQLSLTVAGQPVALDDLGRARIIAGDFGKTPIEATATDADGLVGHTRVFLRVRDPLDKAPPQLAFHPLVGTSMLRDVTAIVGSVADQNLEYWRLEIAPLDSDQFVELSTGETTVANGTLAELDPGRFINGFYRLRLTARDISRRKAESEIIIEINSPDKPANYQRTETDLLVDLGQSTFALTRTYDSLARDRAGHLGYGWRWANREVHLQTNVVSNAEQHLGVYPAFREGTRLYLTAPDGQRLGFTFAPQEVSMPGVVCYRPAWQADPGVAYELQSVDLRLSRGGNQYFDQASGQPYNPANPLFAGADYTLVAPDGTQFVIDSVRGIVEQTTADGQRLFLSDSGVTAANGQSIEFLHDGQGRLTYVLTADGPAVAFEYDEDGNLTSARNLIDDVWFRYGYDRSDPHLLLSASGSTGPGEAIVYGADITTVPIRADLGGVGQFVGQSESATLAAGVQDRYTVSLRSGEVASTSTGRLLLRVAVTADPGGLHPAAPTIAGLDPVATHVGSHQAVSLFVIDRGQLLTMVVAGTDHTTSGAYQLDVSIAGDVNADGLVDGLDSQAVTAALGTIQGGPGYAWNADVDGNGVIDSGDVQILASNFGFRLNQAPILNPYESQVLTHVDLPLAIPLADLATDPEADSVFYRIVGVTHGIATLSGHGQSVVFTPEPGYAGEADLLVVADDGANPSDVAAFTITVSDAPLVSLDITNRLPRLRSGEKQPLLVIGGFQDQQNVPLEASYVLFTSSNPSAIVVDDKGVLSGRETGTSIIVVSRGRLQAATVATVGIPSEPLDLHIYNSGLFVYPTALTLPISGGERQFLVKAADQDLAPGDTGTIYIVGDPQVIDVSPDGLVTSVGLGETTLTILHGAGEAVVPIRVEQPQAGLVVVGANGAVVEGPDGAIVSISPGSLIDPIDVSINPLAENELPVDVPPKFVYAGGFDLDVGDESLTETAQLAVPVAPGTAPGETVYFLRELYLTDETGEQRHMWEVIDSGIVGDDGIARTTSPPYPGFSAGGQYLIAQLDQGELPVRLEIGLNGITGSLSYRPGFVGNGQGGATYVSIGGGGAADIPIMAVRMMAGMSPFAIAPMPFLPLYGVTLWTYMGPNPNTIPEKTQEVTIAMPEYRETYTTTLFVPPLDVSEPVVQSVVYNMGSHEVTFTGQNLAGVDKVVFQMGAPPYPKSDASVSKGQVTATVPAGVVVGLAKMYAVDVLMESGSDPALEVRSNPIQLQSPGGLGFATDGDTLVAFEVGTDTNTLVDRVPLTDFARETQVTADRTRVYMTMPHIGVGVVDAVSLRQVDVIRIPEMGYVSEIAIDPNDEFLYVVGTAPVVYVVDIRPTSDQFHQVVQSIPLSRGSSAHAIAIGTITETQGALVNKQRGHRLYVAARLPDDKGAINVINIDPKDEPKAGELNTKHWREAIATVDSGWALNRIIPTEDPHYFALTYAYHHIYEGITCDRLGYCFGGRRQPASMDGSIYKMGTLHVANDAVDGFVATTGNVVTVGSPDYYFSFSYDLFVSQWGKPGYKLNTITPADVAVLPDLSYAFVSDRELVSYYGYPGQYGSKVGVIQNPFGLSQYGGEPVYLGATVPIEYGDADDLAISSDGSRLFASYMGYGEILIMDTAKAIAAATRPEADDTPIDIIDPGLHIAPLTVQGGGTLGMAQGISLQPTSGLTLTAPVNEAMRNEGAQVVNPTFKWKVTGAAVAGQPVTSTLYVSTFPLGEGLFPDDFESGSGVEDCHPNRILTRRLSASDWDGSSLSFQFALPANIKLTAGQTYYWGIDAEAGAWRDREWASFSAAPIDITGDAFDTVTIITHGFKVTGSEGNPFAPPIIPQWPIAFSQFILNAAGGGTTLMYDKKTGSWGSSAPSRGQPLVLIVDWVEESGINDSGFAEAAADALFAALVKFNDDLGGDIFRSPLHFIGH